MFRWIDVIESQSRSGISKQQLRFSNISRFKDWIDELLLDTDEAYPIVRLRNWAGGLMVLGVSEFRWFVMLEFEGFPDLSIILESLDSMSEEGMYFYQLELMPMSYLLPCEIALKCVEKWMATGNISVVPKLLVGTME